MAETEKEIEATQDPEAVSGIGKDEAGMKLVSEMLEAKIADIKPQYDFSTKLGFIYPIVEQTIQVKGEEVVSILESMTDKGIMKRRFFDRLLRCPRCQSMNLRPSAHCPKCNSKDIVRGRVFEHLACRYVGLEDEFRVGGRYICPRCETELRTMGADYQSRGVLRKCRDCGEIFSVPLINWVCLKCSSVCDEDKVDEISVYSYTLDESKRNWLEFELQPKEQFIKLLRRQGYKVTENARVKGRSGAEHSIDIVATRDDGLVTHSIAIGIEIARNRVGLDKVLDFDVKAYDGGFHNKVLIVIPELGEEAKKFAHLQRIEILEPKELERVLTRDVRPGVQETEKEPIEKEPFEFKSKAQLIEYLEQQGYTVKKNAKVKGRSGAVHSIDILATRDESIITHRIAIDIEVAKKPIGLDRVFKFDDKAYDAGILDKVVIAVPGLTKEARQFAGHQGTMVFEAGQLEPAAKQGSEAGTE
jgi:hypothetical protein